MNKIVQMLNAKECPCVFHLPMSGTWQRFTISQRQEGNSYDVNVSTVWVFKNHGVKITSRLKTSTLDGGCANHVALFLKTSLVKLELCQTMCVQMIIPCVGQIRTCVQTWMLGLMKGPSRSYNGKHMQPADACVRVVLDRMWVHPPQMVWNTPGIEHTASIIGRGLQSKVWFSLSMTFGNT